MHRRSHISQSSAARSVVSKPPSRAHELGAGDDARAAAGDGVALLQLVQLDRPAGGTLPPDDRPLRVDLDGPGARPRHPCGRGRVDLAGNLRRRPEVVVVAEPHPLALGDREAGVAGGGQALRRVVAQDADPIVGQGGDRCGGAVVGALVDHHDVEVDALLVQRRPEHLEEEFSPVAGRDDDGAPHATGTPRSGWPMRTCDGSPPARATTVEVRSSTGRTPRSPGATSGPATTAKPLALW